jgi:cell division protein FtsI (penicillin-binding protein 3)
MKKSRFEFIDLKIVLFLVLFGLLYGLVGYRLYDLQINRRYNVKLEKSMDSRVICKKIIPERGTIFDSEGNILAMSRKVKSLYCIPSQVEDRESVARTLSSLTGMSQGFLLSRMEKKGYFSWLKRKLTEEEYDSIKKEDIKGIGFREEYQRFYPKGDLFCHILGYVDIDNEGIEGMEKFMEKTLRGEDGRMLCEMDAQRTEISSLTKVEKEDVPGNNITLTINEIIQQVVNEELDKIVENHDPVGVVGIVMESKTGRILGMCSKPSYDPSSPGSCFAENRRNRAITDMYEPGSVFKVITTSAALDNGKVDINDVFFCENGAWYVSGRTLHDTHPYGDLSVKDIIVKSSNIGAAKIAMLMENDIFYDYIAAFGFGSPTGICLPGEARGVVAVPSRWSKLSKPSMAFGHEILVTPLQIVTGVNVIASGGYYMEPRLIEKIESPQGRIIYRPETEKKKIISERAVLMIKEAMKGVVSRNGTAEKASLKRYTVAGKTGTAQKLNENGGYSHSKFVSSFVGFVPADDPVITILVLVDEPRKNGYYGGSVAAPTFASIAEKVMKYLNIFDKEKIIYVKAAPSGQEG